jgi:hypothetical protein
MKKRMIITAAVLFSLLIPALRLANAATQSFTGVISDSMCKQKHMMPGKTDAQCVEECVKAGASYVLISGNKVYTLSAKKGLIAPFAGKKVQVQGNLQGASITVTAIK